VNFMLNGSVFVILGMELEMIAEPILTNPIYNPLLLLVSLIALTFVLFAIRFVMIYGYYAYRTRRLKKKLNKYMKDMLLLTFSGVKGTVSIATILLIPSNLEQEYPLLLFLVAGVTLVSFLTGLLILPHFSDEQEESKDYLMHIAILNEVTSELEKELEGTRNKLPLYAAIDNYHGRIENLILSQENKSEQEDWEALKLLILSIESDGLEQAYEEDKMSERAYRVYQRYLKNMEQSINRKFASRLTYYFLVSLRILRFLLHEVFTFGKTFRSWKNEESQKLRALDYDQIAELYLENTEMIIESLENLKGVYKSSLISFMQDSRLRETAIITSGAFVERVINRVKPNNIDEMLRGYYLERKLIFEYEEKRLITTKYAKKLRQNVNNLENYSLKEAANTLPYDMVEWIWIHMAINAGVTSTAARAGKIDDPKQLAINLMRDSHALSIAVKSVRETVKVVKARGVNLKLYKNELLPYKIPSAVAGMIMKRMFATNILTRKIMTLHNNTEDLLFVCKCLYDTGKQYNINAPIFYNAYEKAESKF